MASADQLLLMWVRHYVSLGDFVPISVRKGQGRGEPSKSVPFNALSDESDYQR